MDNRKFEQLIDMIINEEEDKARALFHDIVVEKSREIYESMMYAEGDMETQPSGQVGDLLDEIGAEVDSEESGMTEEDDEFADIDVDDEDGMGDDDMDMGDGEEELEDRVVDLEDKLDMLMAEFEELMGQEGDMGDEEMGDMGDMGDEEMMEGRHEDEEGEEAVEESEELEEEENLEESVQLKKVPGLYDSKIGGDDGDNTKSIALTKPKVTQTGASPVKFSGHEAGKGGTQGGVLNPSPKTIPGSYKNAPGGKNFSEKGEAAPKPKHGEGSSGQNNKSIVGESKKSVKKIIKK